MNVCTGLSMLFYLVPVFKSHPLIAGLDNKIYHVPKFIKLLSFGE